MTRHLINLCLVLIILLVGLLLNSLILVILWGVFSLAVFVAVNFVLDNSEV